jgi:hypothetical protein
LATATLPFTMASPPPSRSTRPIMSWTDVICCTHGSSPQFVALAVIGAALFGYALARFRLTIGTMA